MAEWLRGRLTEAERAIAASVTEWRETGQLTMAAWGYYSLVLIRRAQGRLDAAVLTCEQALDTLVTAGRPRQPPDRATWAWPISPISGTSSTSRCGTRPRA